MHRRLTGSLDPRRSQHQFTLFLTLLPEDADGYAVWVIWAYKQMFGNAAVWIIPKADITGVVSRANEELRRNDLRSLRIPCAVPELRYPELLNQALPKIEVRGTLMRSGRSGYFELVRSIVPCIADRHIFAVPLHRAGFIGNEI